MAHNVTDRDQMFTVREPAWHGLGVVLPEYGKREELQPLVHGWEPVTAPLYVGEPTVTTVGKRIVDEQHPNGFWTSEEVPDIEHVEVPGFRAVQRSDTGSTLGVVSDTYELVSNNEMWDIAEAIEGESSGDVMYETGGSLKGGAKVWLLIRLRDPLTLPGDTETGTIAYYALQNAHDGSGSFRGQATMTRIVCDNTAQMADLDAKQRGTQFTFRHTRSVKDRIEEARTALAGWRESIDAYRMLAEHLGAEQVTRTQVYDFMDRFIPGPPPSLASERVRNNIAKARSDWQEIYFGQTNERIQGSRWGLVQASVEYLNHGRRANTEESRFKRAYLDQDRLTQDAMRIAQAV